MSGKKGMKWRKGRKPPYVPTGKAYSRVRCPICGALREPYHFDSQMNHNIEMLIARFHGRGQIEYERKPLPDALYYPFMEGIRAKCESLFGSMQGDSWYSGYLAGLAVGSMPVVPVHVPISVHVSEDDIPMVGCNVNVKVRT